MVEKERKTVAAHVAEQADSAMTFMRRHGKMIALLLCITVFTALLGAAPAARTNTSILIPAMLVKAYTITAFLAMSTFVLL